MTTRRLSNSSNPYRSWPRCCSNADARRDLRCRLGRHSLSWVREQSPSHLRGGVLATSSKSVHLSPSSERGPKFVSLHLAWESWSDVAVNDTTPPSTIIMP